LKFLAKWNTNEGIPDKHEGHKRKENVFAHTSFVTHGLVKHPKAASIGDKREEHDKESYIDILKEGWPDPNPEEKNEPNTHGNEPS